MRPAPVLVLLLPCLLPACGAGPEGGPRNLILISIDTLRADRLGCYGYGRDTSPALDRFAAGAALFERAYAAAPWTLPSHVTLLSGLLPATHGVDQPDLRPGADTRLLAEVLRDAGYYTFAHTDGGWLGADFDLDRGFLAFEDEDRELADTLARVRAAIAEVHGKRPFFAFVHTYDVHCPYFPGAPYDAMFASPGAQPLETAGRCGNPDFNARGVSAGEALFLSDVYDGEVRKADEALGGFFAFLEQEGVLMDTVVAFVSDHGEEFGEHGRIGHEESVYPELLRVPLIVRAPGVRAQRLADPVSLVDAAPTLLALAGAPALERIDGRSLAPLLAGRAAPDPAPRVLEAELAWKAELHAWIQGSTQWIEGKGRLERYDLAADPLAAHDLAPLDAGEPAFAAARAAVPARAPPRKPLPALPGEEARRELERIGYAGR